MVVLALSSGCAPPAGTTGSPVGSLTVVDGASRLRISLESLPGRPYRITTPEGSGLRPRMLGERRDDLRLALEPTGEGGPDEVDIRLDRATSWDISLPVGAGEQELDLAEGRIRRVLTGGGTGKLSLRLPPPVGPVPITLGGPIGELVIAAPGAAARIRLRGGAAMIVGPGRVPRAAPPGHILDLPGTSQGRYLVDAGAEIQRLTLWEGGTARA